MKKAQSLLVGTRERAGLHGTYYVGRGALRSPLLPPAFRPSQAASVRGCLIEGGKSLFLGELPLRGAA